MPKRVGNIWPSICDINNIALAHKKAKKDKSFYRAVKKTEANINERFGLIQEMLTNHTYKVSPYVTSRKKDGKKERILYKLPYYPDRII